MDTKSLFQQGLAQVRAGQMPTSDTIGTDQTPPPAGAENEVEGGQYVGLDGDPLVYRAEDEVVDSPASESDEAASAPNQSDSAEAQSSDAKGEKGKAPQGTSTKEVITVSDEKGKRKIEIDYTDREAIKKAHLFAAGFRKMQHERDQTRTQSAELQKKLADSETTWKALNDAYSNGIEGLVDLLEGRKGAFKEWEDQRHARRDFLKSASPEERELFETKERLARVEADRAKQAKEQKDWVEKLESEREAADRSAAESKVLPVFGKYRFEGKLGDKESEQMFDEMLWNTALKRLEPYEEKYGSAQAIPQEIINSTFRDVAGKVNARIKLQAEKKAAKVVEQKKQEATENVQASVKSGYQSGTLGKEASDLLAKGDLKGLLKNFGKYKSVFGNR